METLEAVRLLRCATIAQLARLLDEPYQNVAKRLRRLEQNKAISKKMQDARCVYFVGRAPRFIDHELLIADLHTRLWSSLKEWKQPYRVPGANPDAWYRTEQGAFWLEVERSNPRSGEWLDKCWAYLNQRGRVHFDLATERKARNLCEAIRASGIRHLGKFWISWRGDDAISPNGVTYHLRPTSLPPDREKS